MANEKKPEVVESDGFKFDVGVPVPPRSRTSAPSELAQRLAAMPVGASYLVPVDGPNPNIKDEKERQKEFNERTRRVANNVGGAIRRFRDKNPDRNFEQRVVNDKTLGVGVRIWRHVDGKKAAG